MTTDTTQGWSDPSQLSFSRHFFLSFNILLRTQLNISQRQKHKPLSCKHANTTLHSFLQSSYGSEKVCCVLALLDNWQSLNFFHVVLIFNKVHPKHVGKNPSRHSCHVSMWNLDRCHHSTLQFHFWGGTCQRLHMQLPLVQRDHLTQKSCFI